MHAFIELIFGEGPDLEAWQMASRAVVVFFAALALIRMSGRRSFGQSTPFDACVTVLIGAVLSRAVVGASPFWSTLTAGAAMVGMHRLIAVLSCRWPWFETLLNGRARELVRHGVPNAQALRDSLMTPNDLQVAIRQKTGREQLADVDRAVMERGGKVSVLQSPSSSTSG